MITTNYIGQDIVYKNKANVLYTWQQFDQSMKTSSRIEDENGAYLIDYYDVEDVLNHYFYSYCFNFFTHNDNPIDEQDAAIALYDRWIKFKFQRLSGIRKEFAALNTEYDLRYNYERFEDAKTDTDELEHGLKRATATNIKDSTNTDFKTGTATDIKSSTASNLKSEINTNIEESETQGTRTDKHPTWTADNQTTGQQINAPGTKTTIGSAENNYTETSGSANDNYTQTVGDFAKNYNRSVGIATDNYTEKVGTAAQNYTQDTGTDTRTLNYDERHIYGSNSVPIEAIEKELEIRKTNLKKDIISEFVNAISYFVYEV